MKSPKLERDLYWGGPCTLQSIKDANSTPETPNDSIEEPPYSNQPEYDMDQPSDIDDKPFKEVVQLPYQGYRKYQSVPRDRDLTNRRKNNFLAENDNDTVGQELWNSYTGNGKLSEAVFNGNFHDYTKAKQEFEIGQFFTPDAIVEKMMNLCAPRKESKIMDITCGMGRVFNFAPNENNCYGMDIDFSVCQVARKLFPQAFISQTSLDNERRTWFNMMDYSIGNPPFNITFAGHWNNPMASQTNEEDGGEGRILSQNMYLDKTNYYLRSGGISVFVVPATWLQGLSNEKVVRYINENFHLVASIPLPIDCFEEYNLRFPMKVMVLQKKDPEISFDLPMVETTFEDFASTPQGIKFYENKKWLDDTYVRSKMTAFKNAAMVNDRFRSVKNLARKEYFEHLRIRGKDENDYKHQCQVEVSRKDPDELLKICKRMRASTYNKRDHGCWVKVYLTSYGVRFARSSNVVSYFNALSDENKEHTFWNSLTKNDIITNDKIRDTFFRQIEHLKQDHFVDYKGNRVKVDIHFSIDFKKFFDKKIAKYELNRLPTSELAKVYPAEYEQNYEMLSELNFGDKKLLPHQLEDLSAMLMKDYALVSWDTGLGKTMGGIAWTMCKGGKTLIVAPSVNILDPWAQQLAEYTKGSVFICKKTKDLAKYKGEDYLVCSFENIPRLGRILKKFKFNNLVMDESDNAKSKTSKRFKELRNIARKIPRKLMMSGTPTRNNVNEIYNQIEMLCNNSVNMMSWAPTQIEYDRRSKEYEAFGNPYKGKPFPAKGGYQAFERCFSPKKLTCFGASETNQDIFNKDYLNILLQSVRFTRIFDVEKPRIDECLGMENKDGQYKEYKQIIVPMNQGENAVYEYILTEFARLVEEHYRQLHDGATASKLVIMRQIMNLLQGTSHPWTFDQYNSDELSTKLEEAFKIIDTAFSEGRKVMMASPWVDTANKMYEECEKRGYAVYRISSEMSKTKRAKIVSAFRAWPGPAIITGTMGCLKSGLNLPEVSVVIAESYPWNYAALHQYAARAIRLNSKEKTTVYCLCSEGSFDVNVFSLILRKEVTNTFVRTSEDVSVEDLTKGFGTDTDMFASALEMVREKVNGRTKGTIKWSHKATIVNGTGDSDKAPTVMEQIATKLSQADESSVEILTRLFEMTE